MQVLLKPILFVMVPLIHKLTGGKGLTLPLVTEEELKTADASDYALKYDAKPVKMQSAFKREATRILMVPNGIREKAGKDAGAEKDALEKLLNK